LQAIYTFRVLEEVLGDNHSHILGEILQPYLAHRVIHEPANGNPLLKCIQRVAKGVCEIGETGNPQLSTVEDCVRHICWPLGISTTRLKEIFEWKDEVTEEEYEKHLFAAGIQTNSVSIVRRCLAKNAQLLPELRYLTAYNSVFGQYERLAAAHAGEELLAYLMKFGTAVVDRHLRTAFFEGAARAGRADIVRFVYDFKREEVPWNFVGDPRIYEHSVLYRAEDTASLEVLKFIAELRTLYPNPDMYEELGAYSLKRCVAMGRLDTVTYAVQLGAHPEGKKFMSPYRSNEPIQTASRRGHIAIVDYLLALGADPKVAIVAAAERGHTELVDRLLKAGIAPADALPKAAAGGYLDVVRLLLDAGVDANEVVGSKSPLASAISKEHTAMFKLLIDRGADVHAAGVAEECVQRARRDGLESMLLLLRAHGVSID